MITNSNGQDIHNCEKQYFYGYYRFIFLKVNFNYLSNGSFSAMTDRKKRLPGQIYPATFQYWAGKAGESDWISRS